MSTTTYTVKGMTCGHCVGSVTEEVGEIPGVTNVDVDLATGAAHRRQREPALNRRDHGRGRGRRIRVDQS